MDQIPIGENRCTYTAYGKVIPHFVFLSLLQEDYNRLLTKYAEAENTIDRLRLEAKVWFFLQMWMELCMSIKSTLVPRKWKSPRGVNIHLGHCTIQCCVALWLIGWKQDVMSCSLTALFSMSLTDPVSEMVQCLSLPFCSFYFPFFFLPSIKLQCL